MVWLDYMCEWTWHNFYEEMTQIQTKFLISFSLFYLCADYLIFMYKCVKIVNFCKELMLFCSWWVNFNHTINMYVCKNII